MSRIVVGFDGSPAARAALGWGREEARLRDADLLVVIVEPIDPDDRPARGSDVLPANAVKQAAGELAGPDAAIRVTTGKPAQELVEACGRQDILAVGARGRSAVAGMLLGSVSLACLHHGPCPVAVVRSSGVPSATAPHHRVVVGIDASQPSRAALRVAALEAKARAAALHAMNVVTWEPIGAEIIVPTTRQLIVWGKDLVERELAIAGVSARPVVIHGHAAEVLVRHSSHADLLVLGSSGHGALASLLLGSTSDHCARHAHCPVLVVPDGNRAG